MIRALALVTALTFAASARADELSDALKLVRDHVEFIDHSPGGKLADAGGTLMFLGAFGAVAVLVGPIGRSYSYGYAPVPIDKIWALVPAAVAGLGGAMMGYGHHLKAEDRRRPRPLPPASHFQTSDGLNEFVGFSNEQQETVVRQNPEFADFILRLAEAYRFVTEHRLGQSTEPGYAF